MSDRFSSFAAPQASRRADRAGDRVPAASAVPTAAASDPPPLGASPAQVRVWFDAVIDGDIPEGDGTLATAQEIAHVLARRAKADNTRRAYRAGVRVEAIELGGDRRCIVGKLERRRTTDQRLPARGDYRPALLAVLHGGRSAKRRARTRISDRNTRRAI